MEIEANPGDLPPAVEATTAAETELAIAQLGDVLGDLETKPQNVPLLQRQIRLMQQLGMTAEVLDGIQRLSQLVMLSEGKSESTSVTGKMLMETSESWMGYFNLLIPSAGAELKLEQFVDILERFEQAEQDYLCELS